jgi:hypothetical protein
MAVRRPAGRDSAFFHNDEAIRIGKRRGLIGEFLSYRRSNHPWPSAITNPDATSGGGSEKQPFENWVVEVGSIQESHERRGIEVSR